MILQSKEFGVFYFISLVFASLVFIQSGFAASVDKLYEATVKVAPEAAESELIAEAFTHVLIKVSGRSNISAAAAYTGMLKKAKESISQFRYDNRASALENATMGGSEARAQQEKWFWVRFDVNAINRLLRDAQLPVWSKGRPETLIWFSEEIKGKRFLQSQFEEPESYATFKQQADNRGISLIFPFLDLQDQNSISASDIWGNFNDAVLSASRRYQAQATLTSRLFKEPSGLWVGKWNLLILGNVQSWTIRDKNKEQVLVSGIDKLADRLAQQFTQVAQEGNNSSVLIQVNNVGNYRAFKELDDYLKNLATVKKVSVEKMLQDHVIYNIHYLGNKSSLIQEIQLGDLLNSVERSQVDNQLDPMKENQDENYKAVILDDLDKTSSSREQALNSIKIEKSASEYGNQPIVPSLQEQPVQTLLPELEYWLAR